MSTMRNTSVFHVPVLIMAPHRKSVARKPGGDGTMTKAPSPGHASTACVPHRERGIVPDPKACALFPSESRPGRPRNDASREAGGSFLTLLRLAAALLPQTHRGGRLRSNGELPRCPRSCHRFRDGLSPKARDLGPKSHELRRRLLPAHRPIVRVRGNNCNRAALRLFERKMARGLIGNIRPRKDYGRNREIQPAAIVDVGTWSRNENTIIRVMITAPTTAIIIIHSQGTRRVDHHISDFRTTWRRRR